MMNLKRTRRMGMAKYILFVPAAAALLLVSNVDALARTLEEKVKEPLLVVNGQVVEHSGAILSQVDIDHVSVLREESARTAYGENAKNGAIVIATKDGGDPIFEKVEKLPQYPGGEQALYNFLAMNCRYPAEAHDWGVQGRVLVSFVVEKDGALSDISTAKVVDLNTGQQMSEMVVIAKKDMTPEEAEAAKLQAEHQAEGLKALKAEAERVVKALPERWQPGEQDGQIVRVRFTLPITFKLR